MDVSKRLDALVAPLRNDVESGASRLAGAAAEILCQEAAGVHADSVAGLRTALVHTGVRILEAQPAMAPLVTLVSSVLEAIRPSDDLPAARAAAQGAARDFAEGAEGRANAVAHRTATVVPRDARVLTLSSSSTVLNALRAAPGLQSVVVLESRPVREGREAARALAGAGIPVVFAVDAAAATLVRGCSLVLLGADSIGDAGCVNKLGSLGAALAAREAGVPVVVAADHTKVLPPGFAQPLTDDRPPNQVWQAPAGVEVWNRYFDVVPLELVGRVVTDRAVMAPDEVGALRRTIHVPDEIRVWAEARVV